MTTLDPMHEIVGESGEPGKGCLFAVAAVGALSLLGVLALLFA